MKKLPYEPPIMEIIRFSCEDIITTSLEIDDGGWT